MEPYKISLSLFLIALALIPLFVVAQDSPDDFVAAHNMARQDVRVGPITWNNTVASYAEQYANQSAGGCQLIHSGGPYGENLAWGSGNLSGVEAVNMWVAEKSYYDYASNTCAPGEVCGHYTQVVWQDSVGLGCAKVRCADGGTFITCNYDPPGNVEGEKPY